MRDLVDAEMRFDEVSLGVESFVAADKTFCVYLAKDEAIIRKQAEINGFPATKVTPIRRMIDPTTAAA